MRDMVAAILFFCMAHTAFASIRIQDPFGRDLAQSGIVLLDWEGYIANPAIPLVIAADETSGFPVQVTLSSVESRIYFDLPSVVGSTGSTKQVVLTSETPRQTVYIAIWPDRDGESEHHTLQMSATETKTGEVEYKRIVVLVADQDKSGPSPSTTFFKVPSFPYVASTDATPYLQPPFPFVEKPISTVHSNPFTITLDFSYDSSGIFQSAELRRTVRQAADDWSYFIDEMHFSTVQSGEESTYAAESYENPGPGILRTNRYPYQDFLIYIEGKKAENARHFTTASNHAFNKSAGRETPLRRSGHVTLIPEWGLSFDSDSSDQLWWRHTNTTGTPTELYSAAQHEIGHALVFHESHRIFAPWVKAGLITDSGVLFYQWNYPKVNSECHLWQTQPTKGKALRENAQIDRLSRKGAYGTVDGLMPHRRWILTKLDLLILKATGYRLKHTSPFDTLQIQEHPFGEARIGKPYHRRLEAHGGIPQYRWSVQSGFLPKGLALNSFSGEISGVPGEAGIFSFVLNVRDQDEMDNLGIHFATHIEVIG